MWCVEYFDSADGLHAHIRSKHHFECSICHDVSPTAEELEEHGKQKYGELQPDKQELEMQRCREEKLEQSEQRKEKAKEEAKQKKYFVCTECVKGFSSKKELDNHIMDKHIFVYGECLKIFHVKAERDAHMEKDHKGLTVKMTEQEKLLVKEWYKRESREEKDRQAKEKWEKVWSKFETKKQQREAEEKKKSKKKPQSKEEAEHAEGDNRDKDEDYHPSEDAGNQSSQDPLYKVTKKELRKADEEGDQ